MKKAFKVNHIITYKYINNCQELRNSARGKGHEEGGSAYAKVGWSLRRPPVPEHLPPKTRVCLLYCVMLSTYSSDINRGCPPTTFFWKKLI